MVQPCKSERRSPRIALAVVCIFIYCSSVTVYCLWSNSHSRSLLLQEIDDRLILAARSLKYLLSPDFHDRAIGPGAIDRAEEMRNRQAVSGLAEETEFKYLYTVINRDGRFFFTAPTVTAEESRARDTWYFYPYDDVPEAFVRALQERRIVFASYSDRWGTFRSVALPQVSPGGRAYLACADFEISHINDRLRENTIRSVITAVFFLMASLPLWLLNHHTRRRYTRRLRIANRLLELETNHSLEALHRSETIRAELVQIFNSAKDGMWVIDTNYRILRVNSALAKMVDRLPEQIVGRKCFDVLHCAVCHRSGCPVRLIHEGRTEVEMDVEQKLPGGRVRPFILSARPFTSISQEIIGIVVNLKDISERHKARQMQLAKTQAESENLAKSRFMATISHEMRTPLNGIIGMAELIQQTALDSNQRRLFQTLINEAESLLCLINDVLDLSRIEAGRLDLAHAPFCLHQVMEHVAQGLAPAAWRKGVELMVQVPSCLDAQLMGDSMRLRQILVNLVGNAVKFTEAGEILLSAKALQIAADRADIAFEIRDTGIGIPVEKQNAIFDRFTQADDSATRRFGGTGLGTTIASELVNSMGGRIELKSTPGQGSTFRFVLAFAIDPQTVQQSGACPSTDQLLAGRHVGLAVSRDSLYDILEAYLSQMGCQSITNLSGQTAPVAGTPPLEKPDLIVMEDGCRSGFAHGQIADRPCVILLPHGISEPGPAPIKAAEYLSRPISLPALICAIGRLTGLSSESPVKVNCPGRPPETTANPSSTDKRILLVEDYPTNQQVALAHLEAAGYQVDLAEDGYQAVEAATAAPYDLILMDIQLPGQDGLQASAIIRAHESTLDCPSGRTPIIAMTAHTYKGLTKQCRDAGMDDFLTKPLKRDGLLKRVANWISAAEPLASPPVVHGGCCLVNREGAPFNFGQALAEFSGRKDLLIPVVSQFIGNGSREIKGLRRFLKAGDMRRVADTAHNINGAAANLTAFELAGTAKKLETAGRARDPALCDRMINELESAFNRLRDHLDRLPAIGIS